MVPNGIRSVCHDIRVEPFVRFMLDLLGPWETHPPRILGSEPSHLAYIFPSCLAISYQTSLPALQALKAFFLLHVGFPLVNLDFDESSGSGLGFLYYGPL